MDFRIIKPKKRPPNEYDGETFVIPVKVLKIGTKGINPNVFPIVFERIDFNSGKRKLTCGITFRGSIEIFGDTELPFYTDCIVYKENGTINFKVIGAYNPGFVEDFYSVEEILNNDENQILDVFKSHYKELNKWVGDLNSNEFDVKKK